MPIGSLISTATPLYTLTVLDLTRNQVIFTATPLYSLTVGDILI